MKQKLLSIALVMAVLAGALAGCGSSGDKSEKANDTKQTNATSSATTDITKLLSLDEAKQNSGWNLAESKLNKDSNPMKQDILFFSDPNSPHFVQLSLIQNAKIPADLGQSAESIYTETKKMLGDVTPVEGIGKDAFWGLNGLHILIDGKYLVISTGNSTDLANLDKAKAIAAIVLPRL